MFKSFRRFVVEHIIRPRWVVNSDNEMGIRIFGVCCYYYKHSEPLIYSGNDPESPSWDFARKREFGEVVKSERPSLDGLLWKHH